MSRNESILFKGTDTTPSDSSKLGKLGEDLAVKYLETRGFTIVLRNFKVTLGRNSSGARVTGEIDVIALHEGVLCFIEVKTRSSEIFSDPSVTVTRRKRRQIQRVGGRFKKIFGLMARPSRIDVVSIRISPRQRTVINLSRDVQD